MSNSSNLNGRKYIPFNSFDHIVSSIHVAGCWKTYLSLCNQFLDLPKYSSPNNSRIQELCPKCFKRLQELNIQELQDEE